MFEIAPNRSEGRTGQDELRMDCRDELGTHRAIRQSTRPGRATDMMVHSLRPFGVLAHRMFELHSIDMPLHYLGTDSRSMGWWEYYFRSGLVSQDKCFEAARRIRNGWLSWSGDHERLDVERTGFRAAARLYAIEDMMTVIRTDAAGNTLLATLAFDQSCDAFSQADLSFIIGVSRSAMAQEQSIRDKRRIRETA